MSQAGKKRRWSDPNDEEDKEEKQESENEVDENEDEDDEEDEEVTTQIRMQAYETFLPVVREMLGDDKPNLQLDVSEKICPVCPTTQRFAGWKALMAHARTIRNKRMHRHRGFYQAMEAVIRPNSVPVGKRDARNVRIKLTEAEEKKLVHPPIVLVENGKTVAEVWSYVAAKLDKQSVETVLQAGKGIILVVFKQDSAMHANYLVKDFEDRRSTGGICGRIAELKDMEDLDPAKQLVNWSMETNVLRGVHDVKKAKEDWEEATVAAHKERQRVYQLEQSKETASSTKSFYAQQAAERESELRQWQQEIEMKARAFEAERIRDARNWERELNELEKAQQRKHNLLSAQLRFDFKKTEKEKAEHLRRLEKLRQAFESGTDSAKETSKKILALESDKERFERELQTVEEQLASKFRQLELGMVEEEENEINGLIKKYEKEKNDVLENWLKNDNDNSRASASTAKDEKDCSVCFEAFNPKVRPRAILRPCGHATTCMRCVKECKLVACPICRVAIKSHVPLRAERVY